MINKSISLIITNYNYEAYVGNAITSVLHQTRPADEIIVIDDGSTDGSREVIGAFGDQVKAIFVENQGVQQIYNTGFAHARGAIIMYLDADDALYPEALQEVEAAFEPGVVKVQFDLDIIDRDGDHIGRRYCNFSEKITAEAIKKEFNRTGTYIWPVTSGNAWSADFMYKIMPLTPPVSHDGVLNTIAPLYGKVNTIPKPLAQYRHHCRNISRTNTEGRVNVIPDFALRISLRKREFDILQQHASSLGVPLPEGDFLDNELVFINYRIMARKIGQEDALDSRRSMRSLWFCATRRLMCTHLSLHVCLAHLIWVSVLAASPRFLARRLIHLRYRRARWQKPIHNLIRGRFGQLKVASQFRTVR
jgi:glycosyltransferase involved in cell wall biosynthesis